MLLVWNEDTPYWEPAIAYVLMGIGVGLSGTPSSNSLTGSVPVQRVGMASGTADLQRDLGGAIMTSVFGALLTAGFASAMGTAIAESGQNITNTTQSELQLSFASAENLAKHPTRSTPIRSPSAAQSSFLDGADWAYFAGMVAIAIGMSLVSSSSRRRTRRKRCAPSITRGTAPPRRSRRRRECRQRPPPGPTSEPEPLDQALPSACLTLSRAVASSELTPPPFAAATASATSSTKRL